LKLKGIDQEYTVTKTTLHHDSHRLFQPGFVKRLLNENLRLAPVDVPPISRVRVERYWPRRGNDISIEWSFSLGTGVRQRLYGQVGHGDVSFDHGPHTCELTSKELQGLRLFLPESNLLVHSAFVDPVLDTLPCCLDPCDERLPWSKNTSASSASALTARSCTMLSYRAGKRATIRYILPDLGESSHSKVGKTFRNGRGQDLCERHRKVRKQLLEVSEGRISVPEPIEYVSDLRLALFEWSDTTMPQRVAMDERAPRAIAALSALHSLKLDDLAERSFAEECAILEKWIGLLRRIECPLSGLGETIVDQLKESQGTIDDSARRTVHADFYDSQLGINQNGMTIFDLDTMACGNPCLDLGNFLAHLYFAHRSHPETAGASVDLMPLVNDYEAVCGQVNRDTLRAYFATSLARIGAIHCMRAHKYGIAAEMLAEAHMVLNERSTERLAI
jgi:hypothetical protein